MRQIILDVIEKQTGKPYIRRKKVFENVNIQDKMMKLNRPSTFTETTECNHELYDYIQAFNVETVSKCYLAQNLLIKDTFPSFVKV